MVFSYFIILTTDHKPEGPGFVVLCLVFLGAQMVTYSVLAKHNEVDNLVLYLMDFCQYHLWESPCLGAKAPIFLVCGQRPQTVPISV